MPDSPMQKQQQQVVEASCQNTPRLPPEHLLAFVKHYFHERDRYLAAAFARPVPLYLQESSVLRRRARAFKAAFARSLSSIGCYYAVKSNNHPDIARVLLTEGFGLDVSSGMELEMALKIGARDIVFSGPGKSSTELELAVLHADRVVILMDSFGELQRLGPIAAKSARPVRCGVRLTVNPSGLWRKFGIIMEDLLPFWESARKLDQINLIGLQFHSSWNLSPDPQILFIRQLGNALAALPQWIRKQIEFIDIGGGYWPPQGEWLQAAGTPEGKLRDALGETAGSVEAHHYVAATPIDEYADRLSGAIHENLFPLVHCRICLEPGRWICNDAVHLLISVVDKKAPDLVITDAGTNTVGWERFETDYFPILNLTRPSLEETPCHILGSLCTPHDVWGYMYFGSGIEPGDILMIPTQGAYTYSLRQHFIKPLPAVYTI
jgi:diaminopimelate decarboxylase